MDLLLEIADELLRCFMVIPMLQHSDVGSKNFLHRTFLDSSYHSPPGDRTKHPMVGKMHPTQKIQKFSFPSLRAKRSNLTIILI